MDEMTPATGPGLDGLLRAAAVRWPDRPALVDGTTTWSYTALDQAVSAAAASLRAAGVATGDRVGLVLGRGPAELVALAAVQRLGACFVPVDPAAPDARITFLLQDSGCGTVLGPAAVRERLTRLAPAARVVDLESLDRSTGPAPGPVEAAQLAYIIYTSGSTGTPKGVAVSGAAAAEHARLAAGYFGLVPGDRLLQFASLGFDVAQEEIWPTWSAGAALVLNGGGLPAAAELGSIVAAQRITVLQLPTAYWRNVLASGRDLDPDAFRTVRLVVIGGEAAHLDDLTRWRASPLAGAELVNAYGPTEAVITATAYRVAPGAAVPSASGGLPIGPAFPGRTTHVLDPAGAPVPVGEVGELHLGGLLAEGYVNRPDTTAERFTRPGGGPRLYRTGDLVRQHDAGVLEFIGRVDGQLKLRGYRMEAGEIEAALRTHDDVAAAAVALVPRAQGEPVLGAALTVRAGRDPDPAEVLRAASAVLPPYMVPTLAVIEPAIPLTANGKVDRAAVSARLEQRYRERPRAGAAAPAADSEAVAGLRPIWCAVLGLDDIGADEDFFELGGDSLLAMQITARCRAAGWTVSPADVLQGGSLRAVAERAERIAGTSAAAAPDDAPGPLELLPAQLRWLRDGPIPDIDAFVLCALFTVPVELTEATLHDVAQLLLDRHAVLRSRFSFTDGQVAARLVDVRPGSVVSTVDVAAGTADDVSARIEQHLGAVQRTLGLTGGPVWRMVHFRVPGAPGRLFLVVHHLLLDGWSMSLLVDDLDAAVTTGLRGRAELAQSTAGVRAVARAVSDYVTGDAARADAKVWLDGPWDEVGPLPYDRHGPGLLPTVRTATTWLGHADTETLTHGLDRSAPRVHELLLAAICVTLAGWSGRATQAVDVYTHSRHQPIGDLDLSRTVGYVQATSPHLCTVRGGGLDEVLRVAGRSIAPDRLHSFDTLRFRSPDPGERATLAGLPGSPARLNYRGQLDRIERRPRDSALGDAPEDPGLNRSPRQSERYQLMFEGDIVDGRLLIGVKYSTDHYHPATVDGLVTAVAGLLADAARELAR